MDNPRINKLKPNNIPMESPIPAIDSPSIITACNDSIAYLKGMAKDKISKYIGRLSIGTINPARNI